MAKNTRSIDRVATKKGQQPLAFFLLLGAMFGEAQAHDLSLDVRHLSSTQLFYKEDWLDKGMQSGAKKVAASLNASAGATAALGDYEVELAAKYKLYFTGSENVLFVAALSETSNKFAIPNQNGRYSLDAAFHMLESKQLTFSKKFQINEKAYLKVSPHIFSIQNYQYGKAAGGLYVEGNDAKAIGTLNRVGTRRYGFLLNEAEDKGWGWGLDVSGEVAHGDWTIQFAANNLLSQLRFATVHYSDRQYNVHAIDGEVQIKRHGQFSMVGEYGHHSAVEKLPVQTEIAIRNARWKSWVAGLYTVNDQVVPWLGYEVQKGGFYGRATTMQFQNLMLDFGYYTRGKSHIGLGVTFSEDWKARVGSIQAKWVF